MQHAALRTRPDAGTGVGDRRLVGLAVHMPNGSVVRLRAPVGQSVSAVLIAQGVPLRRVRNNGTESVHCHLRIASGWRDRLPPAMGREAEGLRQLRGTDPSSRLGCEIALAPELDGLEFALDSQSVEPQTFWTAG